MSMTRSISRTKDRDERTNTQIDFTRQIQLLKQRHHIPSDKIKLMRQVFISINNSQPCNIEFDNFLLIITLEFSTYRTFN